MEELTIKVKKLDKSAFMPLKKDGDAGWDLFAIEDVTIAPGEVKAIRTGIALGIPQGYRIALRDRGSMGRQGITVTGGVIDGPYIGELIVCLANIKTNGLIIFIYNLLSDMVIQSSTMILNKICGKEMKEPEVFEENSLDGSDYYISKGDRIVQFVLEEDPQFVTLLEVDELEETERGDKGFGSSGK